MMTVPRFTHPPLLLLAYTKYSTFVLVNWMRKRWPDRDRGEGGCWWSPVPTGKAIKWGSSPNSMEASPDEQTQRDRVLAGLHSMAVDGDVGPGGLSKS